MIRQVLTVLIALTFASCKQNTSLTEKEKKIVIQDVTQTLNNYYNNIRKSGLMAEFKYLDNSPDFYWVPPGYSSSISYDSVAVILKQTAPKYKYIDNSFDKLQIIALDNEIATYTGQLKSIMTDTAGKEMTFSMVETGVLIKRQDGWKLLSGQTTVLNN